MIRRNFRHNSSLCICGRTLCGQKLPPLDKVRFGLHVDGSNTCGIIALYNALGLCGVSVDFARLCKACEWISLLFGIFGVNPYLLPCIGKRFGISLKRHHGKLVDGGIYIFVYRTRSHIFSPMHFVCAQCQSDGLMVYNIRNCEATPILVGFDTPMLSPLRLLIAYRAKAIHQ